MLLCYCMNDHTKKGKIFAFFKNGMQKSVEFSVNKNFPSSLETLMSTRY